MKNNVVWNVIFGILLAVVAATEVFAVIAISRLNMLPPAYMAVLIGVLVVFCAVVGLLLFLKGKKPGKIRKICAAVLAVVLICGCTALGTVALDIIKTLELTRQDTLEITTREIYVLADNQAVSLADTSRFTYGYIKDYDESCTQQVLDEIREKTGTQVSTAGYTNMLTMITAFLDNKIDAIILNGGLISILEEFEELDGFYDRTRILTQVRVLETNAAASDIPDAEEEVSAEDPNRTMQTETADETEQEEQLDFSELKPFVVYVSGSDSRDTEIVYNSRSDVNILAVVNPLTKQVLLINSPRDFYVINSAAGGEWEKRYDKLTHCGVYGTKCSMRTLGNLYGVDVDYFVRINFTGFKKMIDALGGITVNSDYEFMAIGRTPIKVGENTLDGQKALDFARERKRVPGGDIDRGRHQMKVITAVIEKATSGTTIINNYSEIMKSVEGMFDMNVPTELISSLMKMQLSDMARWNIVSYAATGWFDQGECYSMPGIEVSVLRPSYGSINKASRLIDMVFAGELLTEEVINSIE